MKLDEVVIKRFEELVKTGEELLGTRENVSSGGAFPVIAPDKVNRALAQEWGISALTFLGRVMDKSSEYYQRFFVLSNSLSTYRNAEQAQAVLRAAFSDYKGGYLFEKTRLIQAEIFDDFLEQAEYHLGGGYFQVAAVTIGAVLEDGLRKLCQRKGIAISKEPKLSLMNDDLVKAGVYDKTTQKKIVWLADLRNKAAHGKWDEFKAEDVDEMLTAVRRFIEDHS